MQNICPLIQLPIETERMILRLPTANDVTAIVEARRESDKDLKKWMYWARHDFNEASCVEVFKNMHKGVEEGNDISLYAFDKKTGDFIMGGGLHRFDPVIRRFEMGYWVRSSQHDNGYATEFAQAMTYYAFKQLQANAVVICMATDNKFSEKVPKRLKFEFEGTMKKAHVKGDGTISDKYSYVRTNADDWKVAPAIW
jgi:ribosomal-protein-serine acetyltransferase